MEQPELARNRRYNSVLKRWERGAEVDEIIEKWTKTKNVDEIVALLEKGRVPVGPVEKFEKVMHHEQLTARNMILDKNFPKLDEKVKVPNVFINLSESPGKIKDIGPKLGEHTDELLYGLLGYSKEKLNQLRKDSAI